MLSEIVWHAPSCNSVLVTNRHGEVQRISVIVAITRNISGLSVCVHHATREHLNLWQSTASCSFVQAWHTARLIQKLEFLRHHPDGETSVNKLLLAVKGNRGMRLMLSCADDLDISVDELRKELAELENQPPSQQEMPKNLNAHRHLSVAPTLEYNE